MKKRNVLWSILLIYLFVIMPVYAVKPITEIDISEGYLIEPTIKDYIKTNTAHEFYIHVFNKTDGKPIISGITCYMHLYNETGQHVYTAEDNTASDIFDYEFNIAGGNFSNRGEYQAKFQCNDSLYGGGQEIYFNVNDYGEELFDPVSRTFNYSMIFLMILFLLALMGLFKFDNPAGKLACYWIAHIFFVVGTFSVWQFNKGYAMSYVGLAGIWKVLFYVSITAIFPMVLLSIAWMVWIHTMNDTIRGFMDRGMDEEEALKRAKGRKYKW